MSGYLPRGCSTMRYEAAVLTHSIWNGTCAGDGVIYNVLTYMPR